MQAHEREISAGNDYVATLRGVWQSVILQAILDATTLSTKPAMQKARTEALAWFCLENDDFIEVCSFADMDPHRVLRGAMREIKRSQHKHKHAALVRMRRAEKIKKQLGKPQAHEKDNVNDVYIVL